MLPHIRKALATTGTSPEHRLWAEHLLARHCLLSNRLVKARLAEENRPPSPEALLAPFRAWSDFWENRPIRSSSGASRSLSRVALPRRRIWQVYYDTVSYLLQHEHMYMSSAYASLPSKSNSNDVDQNLLSNSKLHQIKELREVERIYEDILLKDVQFPKANEANVEVENWADQVMANWAVISQPSWRDHDLGEGGKQRVARNVLAVRNDQIKPKINIVDKICTYQIIADTLSGCDTYFPFHPDPSSFVFDAYYAR